MVVHSNALQKFFLLLPLVYPNQTPVGTQSNFQWSYANTHRWSLRYPQCSGQRQSPIHITSGKSYAVQLPPLRFHNYDVPLLSRNLVLTNEGHSVELLIPPTVNGTRPYITGGTLQGRYEAANVHFHWGDNGYLGSEHVIDNRRFDAEMHIVHRNVKYATISEAAKYADGISVIAVMFKIVINTDRFYPGLNKIFNQLPAVVQYRSRVRLNGDLSMRQLLGDLNTKNFFTYRGSLTSPDCAEAVTWQIFPDPLPIAYEQMHKFWFLLSAEGGFLVNNYRPLQRRNGRRIFYRSTQNRPYL